MVMEELLTCEKCEDLAGVVKCSCGARFCEKCFTTKHLIRNPKHKRGGTSKTDKAWAWISGAISALTETASRATYFEQDQVTKWFGLHVQRVNTDDRVTRLVETSRFSRLVGASMHYDHGSPRRQFPSITSFVGETGAGKSTLIRSLIYIASRSEAIEDLEVPIPGVRSGSAACLPTTGEVNLYLDPHTFGTRHPQFFADCEGMLGGEPAAAQHQKEWFRDGRRYLLESKDGKPIDRKTAVMTIYPRFLYIFSDVICMVTRNQKAWADSAVKLLEWSQVGAHNTVNQYALPALIIILNGPTIENEAWTSDDQDAATRDFFMAIEKEINENATLRKMASKHGDKNMKELLLRNFSSVHVHYIPLEGFQSLGNSGTIMLQTNRLALKIQQDVKQVQARRANTWTLFDARQLSIVFDYAFKHLASGSDEPFDFAQCRQQITLPESTEGHFAEFIGRCLHNRVDENFDATARIVGSCIVRNSLKLEGTHLLHPYLVFHTELKNTCRRALDQFLGNTQPCAYIHLEDGEKCINTKTGHAKGHQSADGSFLAEGSFVNGVFDGDGFIDLVNDTVSITLKTINERVDSNRQERRQYAASEHRYLLKSIPDQSFWKKSFTPRWIRQFNQQFGCASLSERASVCYACLFGRPEYTLPCAHVICSDCIREFDQSSTSEIYPGVAIHKECVLCSSNCKPNGIWPYTVEYQPDLSGVRVLALDGGGVRGIIQLSILQRLEDLVNLDIPFGELFDLMVGTSAGGLIAIGLGIHMFSVEDCITKFKTFCEKAFDNKTFTKTHFLGWWARFFTSSIYKTKPLEDALKELFGTKPFFGQHGNVSRVAVTTTVDDKSRLLANYNWGYGKKYLNSNIDTWLAARCTSAAPMYFDPVLHEGDECRDGGLLENNPVQTAVNETRAIFGREAVFDLVLSLGCGNAPKSQTKLDWAGPEWLESLYTTLIETTNGESAWLRFVQGASDTMLSRCKRLNIEIPTKKEPELDDTTIVNKMEEWAKSTKFHYAIQQQDFAPLVGVNSGEALEILANRLKASLYFFELRSLTRQDDVAIIKGWICCRLRSSDRYSYRSLIEETSYFEVKGKKYRVPAIKPNGRLKLDVSFQQQDSRDNDPIRIDVKFRSDYQVTISGFPMTLRKLKVHWDMK